jgi:hypothetical protein
MAGNRPRIRQLELETIEVDTTAFGKNKCSDFAKKIITHSENIEIDIWFDQHYHIREQQGDENGKRDGIDNEAVIALVKKAILHLLHYSTKVKPFVFVNIGNEQEFEKKRIVLYKTIEGEHPLNVVIECHFISLFRYEVTVKTAMCVEGFRLSNGQYKVEFDGNNSTLFKRDGKNIDEVANYSN